MAKSIVLERQQHFDPYILQAFLESEDEFLRIRDLLPDQEISPAPETVRL